jgi:hypothetical protein
MTALAVDSKRLQPCHERVCAWDGGVGERPCGRAADCHSDVLHARRHLHACIITAGSGPTLGIRWHSDAGAEGDGRRGQAADLDKRPWAAATSYGTDRWCGNRVPQSDCSAPDVETVSPMATEASWWWPESRPAGAGGIGVVDGRQVSPSAAVGARSAKPGDRSRTTQLSLRADHHSLLGQLGGGPGGEHGPLAHDGLAPTVGGRVVGAWTGPGPPDHETASLTAGPNVPLPVVERRER